jgi:hypothetical protein
MPQMVNKIILYCHWSAFFLSCGSPSFTPDKRQKIVQFFIFRYVFTQQMERHDAELRVIMHFLHLFCSYFLHKHNFHLFVSLPNTITASHCVLLLLGY